MRKLVMVAIILASAAFVSGPAKAAPYLADTYNAKCNYRCCDQNRNCSVHYFLMGGKSSWPNACDWTNVCSKQGTIGWSYGGTPTEKNSSLTLEKGCWQRWDDWVNGRPTSEIRSCAPAAPKAKTDAK